MLWYEITKQVITAICLFCKFTKIEKEYNVPTHTFCNIQQISL